MLSKSNGNKDKLPVGLRKRKAVKKTIRQTNKQTDRNKNIEKVCNIAHQQFFNVGSFFCFGTRNLHIYLFFIELLSFRLKNGYTCDLGQTQLRQVHPTCTWKSNRIEEEENNMDICLVKFEQLVAEFLCQFLIFERIRIVLGFTIYECRWVGFSLR